VEALLAEAARIAVRPSQIRRAMAEFLAYYDLHRAAGDTHHHALRALGNRLIGIPHDCLTHHVAYNETVAWAHRPENKLASAA
jgi:hypothetical protein